MHKQSTTQIRPSCVMHLVSREISLWDHIFAWDKMAYVLIKEKKTYFCLRQQNQK